MKLVYENEVQIDAIVGNATTGHRCDEIRFSLKDMERLYAMRPEVVHAYIGRLMCHFVPPKEKV